MWVLSFPIRRLALSQHADKSEVVEKVESERCFCMFVAALPFVLLQTPLGRLCRKSDFLLKPPSVCQSLILSFVFPHRLSVPAGKEDHFYVALTRRETEAQGPSPGVCVCLPACVRACMIPSS